MLSKIAVAMRTHAAISAALCLTATAAYADVVVVVSAKAGVESLSAQEVSQIFLAKKAYTFPNGEQAIPIDQYDGNAVRDEFYAKVVGKTASQLRAYWSDLLISGTTKRRPQMVPDSTLVKKMVAGNPGEIGYISKDAVDSSVRVVLVP